MIPAETVDISKMQPGSFWARVRSLGLSDADSRALLDGTASRDVLDRAAVCADLAKYSLIRNADARPS